MSERTISIVDLNYFEVISNFIELNKDEHQRLNTNNAQDLPVYTAGKDVVAYIKEIEGKSPVNASEQEPVLTFASNGDGSAGRNFIYHIRPFYINRDRIGLRCKDGNIDLRYVWYCIKDMKRRFKFDHTYKASPRNIGKVYISIPLNGAGEFDLRVQTIMAERWLKSELVKSKISDYIQMISNNKIIPILPSNSNNEVSLADADIFSLSIGERVLRKDIRISHGTIPVYSANVFQPFGFISNSNIDDFSRDSILYGIDGNYGLNIIPKNTIFATTDHCGRIVVLRDDIRPEYILYSLSQMNDELGFGRTYRANLSNMKKITIPIPINDDGTYDIELQKQIANRYIGLENIKQETLIQLKRITDIVINFDKNV